MYIVGRGIPVVCDNLPYSIESCECCGYGPQFSRGFTWLKKSYIKEHQKFVMSRDADGDLELVECDCPATKCPICHPSENNLEEYGLMWVGDKYYTPEEFISEAISMGVSKAINKIPKDLVLGKTWIMLAHNRHPFINEEFMSGESDYKPAIFYAFIPSAFEMLVWEKDATPERLAELKAQCITPIVIPDDAYEHGE